MKSTIYDSDNDLILPNSFFYKIYLEKETICGKICRKHWKSMGILFNACRCN